MKHDDAALVQGVHQPHDVVLVADVEVVGGPIEQQMLGLLGECSGDEHLPALGHHERAL